jgi:hypothetical protein
MAYLAEPTSKTAYGVVQVGNYIDVVDGIISNPQDLSANASVGFSNVAVSGNLTANGNLVVTSVTPSAGVGIALSNVKTTGYDSRFTVTNTGVTQLVAGTGISLSANTGNITISSFGADLINVYGTTTSYTATADDEYIGVNSASAVTITLPAGPADGRVYIIKDEKGQGSGKITIQPPVGTLIDAKVNYVIGVPNQSVNIVYRADGWWII